MKHPKKGWFKAQGEWFFMCVRSYNKKAATASAAAFFETFKPREIVAFQRLSGPTIRYLMALLLSCGLVPAFGLYVLIF